MNPKAALNQVRKGQPAAVYVCYGLEKYLMDDFIRSLTQQLIEPDHLDFAVTRFELKENSIESVIEDAETVPFMVPKKLVIASDAYFLTGARQVKGVKVEHDVDHLLKYIQSPVEYTVLLITVEAEKLDERKKLVKQLKELSTVVNFSTLTANDLTHWIKLQAEQLGCSIEPTAIDALVMNSGANLQGLSAELEKLSLYVGQKGTITTELIQNLVVRSTEQSIFKMIEDIVHMRLDQALSIYYDLLKQKEEPVKICMLIARQFRIMLQVKELSQQGYTQQQIASQLKLHPYVVKLSEAQARRYSEHQLIHIMNQLADLDYHMKTGQVDKVIGIEMFLLKLVS